MSSLAASPASAADGDLDGPGFFLPFTVNTTLIDYDWPTDDEVSETMTTNHMFVRENEKFLIARMDLCSDEVSMTGDVMGEIEPNGDLTLSGSIQMWIGCDREREFDTEVAVARKSNVLVDDGPRMQIIRGDEGDAFISVSHLGAIRMKDLSEVTLPTLEHTQNLRVTAYDSLLHPTHQDNLSFPGFLWSRMSLRAGAKAVTVSTASICGNGETRGEYTLLASIDREGNVQLIETMDLFEGTSCDTTELEDSDVRLTTTGFHRGGDDYFVLSSGTTDYLQGSSAWYTYNLEDLDAALLINPPLSTYRG